jgi:ankyrin repeat protein
MWRFLTRRRLISAVKSGDAERVAAVLQAGADPEFANMQGIRALALAAEYGWHGVVDVLIQHGADVNGRSTVSHPVARDVTALMAACGDSTGDPTMVAKLIEHGARLNDRDSHGRTALMYAVVSGHAEIVRTLLDSGADVDLASNDGDTPIDAAMESSNPTIRDILLGHERATGDETV